MSRPYASEDPLAFVLDAAWADAVLKQRRHPIELVTELCASRMYGDALVWALVAMLQAERAEWQESVMFHGKPSDGLLGDVSKARFYERLLDIFARSAAAKAAEAVRCEKDEGDGTVNQVTLSGRLATDPELRDVNGHDVCRFRLAFTRRVKRGEAWEKETGFITVDLWAELGRAAAKTLKKGGLAVVTGELRFREWEAQGGKRSELSLHGHEFEAVAQAGGKNDAEGNQSQGRGAERGGNGGSAGGRRGRVNF